MLVQAQPFLSYGVLIINLAVYAAGLGLRFSLGESSGEDYFYMLAKVNDEVVQGEYYRCCSLEPPIMGWCVLSLLAPELLTALTSDLIWGSHCTWGLYMQCCHSYARGRILLSWIEMNPAALV